MLLRPRSELNQQEHHLLGRHSLKFHVFCMLLVAFLAPHMSRASVRAGFQGEREKEPES